ncbi:MAG TPA: hypothetical protein VEB66_11680 [Opitutaceae bacterium]|nr:hypothetical protein [Opitutaceae bacterium]
MITTAHQTPHRRRQFLWLAFGAALAAALAGCGRSEGEARSKGGHAHAAPHGGVLVELGDHQYNLELVLDEERGVLQAYVLDGHAENFVRTSVPEFVVTAVAAGKRQALVFRPVANPVTGETMGNTSLFEAKADWLAGAKAFDGTLQAINVRGTVYTNIPFKFSLVPTADDPWAQKKK